MWEIIYSKIKIIAFITNFRRANMGLQYQMSYHMTLIRIYLTDHIINIVIVDIQGHLRW